MTIGIIFQFNTEIIEVKINGYNVFFRNSAYGSQFVDISGLKLNKNGAIKEFPDLENDNNWEKKTIERFMEKIKNMKTEKERAKYIIDDLTKFGYVAKYMQRGGFRPEKIRNV